MIDVLTPKRISPDCPFNYSVVCSLTLQCDADRGVWLCGMMHTAELLEKSNIKLLGVLFLSETYDVYCLIWFDLEACNRILDMAAGFPVIKKAGYPAQYAARFF